jgi:hypothetical protein
MSWRAPTQLWRFPGSATQIAVGLVLVAIVAAGTGRQVVFDLAAENPARSVHRFASGAPEVEVTTQMPWSRVPAVLPGPADAWAGESAHAIIMRPPLSTPRTLLLHIHTRRTRPPELPAFTASTGGSVARLRVLVNGVNVTGFDAPGIASSSGERPRAPPRTTIVLPASTLGRGAPVTITLLNDGGPGVAFRRVRLVEAVPWFSLSRLGLGGRFPAASAAFLAAALGLLLGARLQPAGDGRGAHPWQRALGPALGLLLLGLAVGTPSATRAVPRGAWLLVILGLLLMGRGRTRPATVPRTPATRLARAVGSGLLLLFALAVSLVAGEFTLRAAFRGEPWVRHRLAVPYVGPPKRGHLNSLGFVEQEFPLEKPPGVYRIAILGDSLSISVARPHRFGNLIAERLNAHSPRFATYEAVSFGQTGADTIHETKTLRRVVWRVKPDFVLLQWYVNDLENGDHTERPYAYPLIPGETAPARWLRRVIDRTLLGWMLQKQFTAVQERLGLVETFPEYVYRMFSDPAGVHWKAAAHELRGFIRECQAHRTPVAIALFPHLSAGLPAGAYEFSEVHEQVLELCREESVPCVDLRSTFVPYRDYVSLWVHRFDPHPNVLAHRLAGERLYEILAPLWLDAGRPAGRPPVGRDAARDSPAPARTSAAPRAS